MNQGRENHPLENTRTLIGAAWGAATRKSMQRSPAEEYLRLLNKEPLIGDNPEEKVIKAAFTTMLLKITSQQNFSREQLLTIPWSSRRIRPSRLSASLIAFSNDHGKKTVQEFFPVDEILTYLQAVKRQAEITCKPLTIIDQYDLALQQTRNNPVAAAILAHSAFRSVARSSDTRLDSRLAFSIDSLTEPITMMNIARSITDFTINDRRDPLGNTYHWWSQFTANMIFSLQKREYPAQIYIYRKAFSLGPELTVGLRSRLLRMPLAAGDHKQVDRQGMRIGRVMGDLLFNETRIRRHQARKAIPSPKAA